MKAFIIAVVLIVGQQVNAGNDGHGGGGVTQNGKYMSFYSAGLYVKPYNNLTTIGTELPALDDLINYISGLNEIDLNTKSTLLDAIIPTIKRQYLIASPKELTPEVHKRLMEEFKRVTGVDTGNLHLFALTDITQKITYILPGFENLSRVDQIAILFHEAYWIMYPSATYNQVVAAEMAFQAALENTNDKAVMYDFLLKLGVSPRKVAVALAKWDLEQGNLIGLVDKKGQIPLRKIYGEEFVNCTLPLVVMSSSGNTEICDVYLKKNMYELLRRYPKSMVLRKMADSFAQKGRDIFIGYKGKTGSGGMPDREGVIPFREQYWGMGESAAKKLMDCPVHLVETNVVDCTPGWYFKGGHLMLNF